VRSGVAQLTELGTFTIRPWKRKERYVFSASRRTGGSRTILITTGMQKAADQWGETKISVGDAAGQHYETLSTQRGSKTRHQSVSGGEGATTMDIDSGEARVIQVTENF